MSYPVGLSDRAIEWLVLSLSAEPYHQRGRQTLVMEPERIKGVAQGNKVSLRFVCRRTVSSKHNVVFMGSVRPGAQLLRLVNDNYGMIVRRYVQTVA